MAAQLIAWLQHTFQDRCRNRVDDRVGAEAIRVWSTRPALPRIDSTCSARAALRRLRKLTGACRTLAALLRWLACLAASGVR
jgi:hypothetical protein